MRCHPLSRLAAAVGTAALAAGLLIAPTATAAPQPATSQVTATTSVPNPQDGWRATCSAAQKRSHWYIRFHCRWIGWL